MMKVLTIHIFLLVLTCSVSVAQDGIGIGSEVVFENVLLQVGSQSADTAGILFPANTYTEIVKISSAENGLFFYDRLSNRFTFSKNGTWKFVNPWDASMSGNYTISTIHEVEVFNSLNVSGDGEFSGKVTTPKLEGKGVVPIGGIIAWAGNKSEIPPNYRLCNGIDTEPNLTGRFIVAGTTPGTTEGSNTLTRKELVFEGGTTSRSVVTSTDNRPAYYVLAFIKRVE